MSIPVPPKKQSRADAADDSENEEAVPVLPVDDDDDTATEQSDDDTNTTNDASSSVGDDDDDDDDAEPSEGEDDGDGGDSDGGGGGGGGGVAAGGESKKNVKKRRTASKKNTEDDLTLLGVPHGIHFDDDEHDDDDDSDDDDENEDKGTSEYFQKLKSNVRESYIATYHPESLSHNYDEIQTLSRVVRNSAGIIVDDLHRTIPIMTKYEKTRILGQRAKQLNEGAPAFIKIDSTVIDGYLIAVKELEQKRTPFIIRRPLPNGGSEYWRVQDLEIL
jgi:DNA-directed RNA polymerase I, II, and III subunit RPABC2